MPQYLLIQHSFHHGFKIFLWQIFSSEELRAGRVPVPSLDLLTQTEAAAPTTRSIRCRPGRLLAVRECASRRPVCRRRRLMGWSGPWTSPSRGL